MDKKKNSADLQTNNFIEPLSENQLKNIVAGEMNPKEVLKWVGVGVGSTVGLALIGVGAAALVGWKKNIGPFKRLHDEFADITCNENIKISDPHNFRHYVPPSSEQSILIKAATCVLNGIKSMEFTKNGPKLLFYN